MNKIFEKLKLGTIINKEIINSNQNTVYKITTPNNTYILKEYSQDTIKNEEDLNLKIKQINISKILNNSGIPTIPPIEFNNNNFINYNNKYYLIYNYLDYKVLTPEDLTEDIITTLSRTLASIHKLNLNHDLPLQYKIINIDYDNYLKEFKDKESLNGLYKMLLDNKNELLNLINSCNNVLPKLNKNLCISHNDYKLKNILWNNDKMYLIDFDATSLSNPAVSLAESSFALSIQNNSIKYNFYKKYIEEYIDTYGPLNTNYSDALIGAMNGKLQWLQYLLSKCNEKDLIRVNECMRMIEELLLFINNKNRLLEIFDNIVP